MRTFLLGKKTTVASMDDWVSFWFTCIFWWKAHMCGYDARISCWKQKKRSLRLSMIAFPVDLHAYSREVHTCVDTTHRTLQHTATHHNTPQHTTTHCSTLQHTAAHCNTLQHVWMSFQCRVGPSKGSTLQNTATHCNTLQRTATHCNMCGCPCDAG